MKLIRKKDAKKCDLKPSQRIKVSGNVFVEVYKDNKGYFYRIDIPGATEFICKERYPNPDKASLAGRTHAQKFMKKIRGDEKKGDAKKTDIDYKKEIELLRELGAQSAKINSKYNGVYLSFRNKGDVLKTEINFAGIDWDISDIKKLYSNLPKLIEDIKKAAIELENKFGLVFKG